MDKYDIEIYFGEKLVFGHRACDLEIVNEYIRVSKQIYINMLYYKHPSWDYKVVIK